MAQLTKADLNRLKIDRDRLRQMTRDELKGVAKDTRNALQSNIAVAISRNLSQSWNVISRNLSQSWGDVTR